MWIVATISSKFRALSYFFEMAPRLFQKVESLPFQKMYGGICHLKWYRRTNFMDLAHGLILVKGSPDGTMKSTVMILNKLDRRVFVFHDEWFNSLAPGRCGSKFKMVLRIKFMNTSCEIAVRRMLLSTFDDESTLVQIMAWCCQATSHYLNQCLHRSVLPYGATSSKLVKPPMPSRCREIIEMQT